MTLLPGQFAEGQQKVLREVTLAYRRVLRAPLEPALTRAEISRRDQKRQNEALAAATAVYRRLSPLARYDQLAVCGEVNRMSRRRTMRTRDGSGTARINEWPLPATPEARRRADGATLVELAPSYQVSKTSISRFPGWN